VLVVYVRKTPYTSHSDKYIVIIYAILNPNKPIPPNITFVTAPKNKLNHEGNALSTNPKTSGRFHSNWLNMLYPRL